MPTLAAAKKRFKPENFKKEHLEKIQELVGTKVKVLVELKPVIRVLNEDHQGFFIRSKGERVAVRPENNLSRFVSLVGLVIK